MLGVREVAESGVIQNIRGRAGMGRYLRRAPKLAHYPLVEEPCALSHSERIPAFRPLTAEEAGLRQFRQLKIRQALVLAVALSRA